MIHSENQKVQLKEKSILNNVIHLGKQITNFLIIICVLFVTGNQSRALNIDYPERPACKQNQEKKQKQKCTVSVTRGGGELFSLIPSNAYLFTNASAEYQGQLTYQQYPTFWFYTFINSAERKSIAFRFTLQDTSENDRVYEKTFTLNNHKSQSGIFSFQLPEDAPPLQLNKVYYWRLYISNDRGESEFVEGYIQRKFIPSQLFGGNLSPQERLEFYASEGIWHDLITELAEQRQQNPDGEKLKEKWDLLLKDEDVDLGHYQNQKFLDCCSF